MTHNQAIKQNLHTYSKLNKRKVLVLFLCLSLCVSFFAFSVSAYTDSSTNGIDFSDQPIPYSSVSQQVSLSSEDVYVAFNNSLGMPMGYVAKSSSSSVYFGAVPYSANGYNCYLITDTPCDVWSYRDSDSSNSYSYLDSISSSSFSLHSTTNLYFYKCFGGPVSSVFCPVFSSIGDLFAAVRDYIDNPPDSGPALEPFSYSLAPGNVIFIDVSGSDPTDVAVLTSSTGFSYSASELQNTNQAFGYLDSIPSSFTLPLSGTNNIPWAPAGNPNLYGKYQHKTRSVYAYSSNHQYFVVVNPTYDPYTLASGVVGDNVAFAYDNSNATNSYIDISGFSARAFKVYSLNSQLIYDSGGWSSVTESDGPSYSGSYDSSTQTWTTVNDTSGESESPPLGGTNNIESDATTSETIFAWLETIASSIGSFFRGSIGAVTSLVASGSEFFRSISGLYSWLPSPVLSVLLNALIIAITIGVIKVFI